jgi:fibronectin type 3 domain-containing protein
MKYLTIAVVMLSLLTCSFGQGFQGHVIVSGKAIVNVTGHCVVLTWTASQGAASYNVYRGTASGGPYARLATGIVNPSFSDTQITHNQTLYYVTTAVSNGVESGYSNQVVAVIP